MRTNVYIDGFNLYYRLLKGNPQVKWLDLKALAEALLQSQNRIQTIRYYTARISGRFDPSAPARQQVYLDALQTIPEITIHLGNFLVTKPWAGLVHPPQLRGGIVPQFNPPYPVVAKVWKTEEKGSDVNLASHLIRDACHIKILSGDVIGRVAAMKAEAGKDIWLMGGGVLFRSLLDAGLVDGVEVMLQPVMLGNGVPLLAKGERQKLHLTESKTRAGGIVQLSYTISSFALKG